MMKRFIFAALTLAATLPAAINVQAQDDDIYFSKKADKKAKKEAIYAENVADEWSTNANNDWNLDDYNRRGKETSAAMSDVVEFSEEAPFYYNIIDEKGDTIKVPGNKNILKGADANGFKVIRDTVVLVEQYHFTDLIRRFHNPFFGYYRYSPWYDVAYYDPFYWDYCYYDPWWYVTPSFGFHWGNWYGGWSFGYYSGWYGGWYSPFYSPNPHYHDFCYYDGYYSGPVYNYATGSSHRGSSRNNFGGHFAHRGGWRGDGGSSSRLASASTNRSYRAANGARVGFTNSNGNYTAGPTLRGRNTVNGRLANSNMRSSVTEYNRSSTTLGASRGGDTSASYGNGSYSNRRHTATRYSNNGSATSSAPSSYDRSASTASRGSNSGSGESGTRTRRGTIVSSNRGFYGDNSASRRAANSYTPSNSSSSYDRSSYSRGSYDSGSSYNSGSSRGSYNSGSSNTRSYSSGSSSSYSSGSSNSGGGGGSYSRGGGGGSHSSGSSHGRR